jgi:hypothetical protein
MERRRRDGSRGDGRRGDGSKGDGSRGDGRRSAWSRGDGGRRDWSRGGGSGGDGSRGEGSRGDRGEGVGIRETGAEETGSGETEAGETGAEEREMGQARDDLMISPVVACCDIYRHTGCTTKRLQKKCCRADRNRGHWPRLDRARHRRVRVRCNRSGSAAPHPTTPSHPTNPLPHPTSPYPELAALERMDEIM